MTRSPNSGGWINRLRDVFGINKLINRSNENIANTNKARRDVRDTKRVILACTQRQMLHELRRNQGKIGGSVSIAYAPTTATQHDATKTTATTATTATTVREDGLLEAAIHKLEQSGMDDYNILKLREEMQKLIAPQIVTIFESLQQAEWTLDVTSFGGGVVNERAISSKLYTKRIEDSIRLVLMKDFAGLETSTSNCCASVRAFRNKKRLALRNIMDWKGWDVECIINAQRGDDDDDDDTNTNENNESDQILKYDNTDDVQKSNVVETNFSRLINFAKSSIVKEELGFSILPLASSKPNAGLGLFVDGRVDIGSILGFFPGLVWTKKQTRATTVASEFDHDDNQQLLLRPDDFLIDSRHSPNVVPFGKCSNIWALAHLANHPSSTVEINCRPVMVNFNEDMGLADDLKCYIPNRYAKNPMLLGYNAFNLDVYMHGLALLATRDLEDEELNYNYGSDSFEGTPPSWYNDCDPDSSIFRIENDNKDAK